MSAIARKLERIEWVKTFLTLPPTYCRPFNSRLALQLAKLNVERDYAVVGTWEHTNETLAVLEAYVPRYFADASKMYYCK